jgi:hypothetical protein
MLTDDVIVARYAPARQWLDELAAIVRVVRDAMPPDPYVFGKRDVDAWLGELAAYQWITCQCCGVVLSADVLGPAAYAVPAFVRICGECYSDCAPDASSWRRHARLAAYASDRPDLLAGLLVNAQTRLDLDDWHIERTFGLDSAGLLRLALCPRPRVGREEADLARIAASVEVEIERLRPVLSEQLRIDALP